MDSNKIKTYINFAKRSRSIVYGVDDILKSRNIQFICISENLAESSKNKLNKFILEKNIDYINLKFELFYSLLNNDAIKVFGITDKNLAKAIKLNFTNGSVSNGGNLE